ncbi:unnamed protein product [Nezara viridula]|uniref:Uncharacterized protein n=1 Tax=Nezara viridula TaxID=85310 RepID=A0A9P0HQR5_NEZVI|nr:unnamed protein product [Nezara viridula]
MVWKSYLDWKYKNNFDKPQVELFYLLEQHFDVPLR